MKLAKFVQPSMLLAIGMLCASVVMLAKNSTAVATHNAAQEQSVEATTVTQLPTIVVMGKRLSPVEKVKYRQMLKASAATLV